MKSGWEVVVVVFVVAAAVLAGAPAAMAEIVWTPGEGWRRAGGEGTGEAAGDFDRAFALYMEARYRKAARLFKGVITAADGPLKEDAVILRAECFLGLRDYRRAFGAFESFAKNYPGSRHMDRALEGELEIAQVLLAGGRIKALGLRIWSAYGLGEKVVDSIISRRPLSGYAAQAQIALARSYFRRHLYIESGSAYRQYVELFPNGPEVREALLGMSRSLLIDARGPRYDPTPYFWASSVASDLARQFPEAPEAGSARKLTTRAASALAEHHFGVAKWYLKRGKADSALVYLRKVVRDYRDTDSAQKAFALLETLTAAGEQDDGP